MAPRELKRIRRGLGLTQAALAAELGVSRVSLARWEIGQHPIPELASRLIRHLAREGTPMPARRASRTRRQ